MLYREAGQYKTTYAADMAVFPLRQDRLLIGLFLFAGFVVIPLTGNDFLLVSKRRQEPSLRKCLLRLETEAGRLIASGLIRG